MDESEFDAFGYGLGDGADAVAEDFFFAFGEAGDIEGEQWEEDQGEEGNFDPGGHEVGGLGFGLGGVLEEVEPSPSGEWAELVDE